MVILFIVIIVTTFVIYELNQMFHIVRSFRKYKQDKISKRCKEYENIFDSSLQPIQFLKMKNQGESPCNVNTLQQLIKYEYSSCFLRKEVKSYEADR